MDACPTFDANLAQRVEAHFLTAWPAMGEMDFDGWRVRISGGYSDRANSVTPLTPGRMPAAEKVKWAESFYGARHLPTLFRITDLYADTALDAWLHGRGYKMSWTMETAVRDLVSGAHPMQALAAHASVMLEDAPTPAWIDAALAVDDKIAPHLAPFTFIVNHIPAPRAFARLLVRGNAVAVGAASAAGDLMGVFLMRTHAGHRRQGHGRAVLDTLLAWGHGQGARTAWLQFDRDRAAPKALYRGAGFKALYNYHYRRLGG
ncbi:MAG: GNAT family N-acetyltransferase [Rhodospirillaceae bacterium]|nr:GNAT family N-acetyltransferase [Rhodospirillaceae bacterium]